MTQALPPLTFAYTATTSQGQTLSGTIDAASEEDARQRLATLQLRVSTLSPTISPMRARRLGGDDFLTFNQQLAQITSVGLPIEQGLSLIAQEIRSPGMKHTVNLVVADLEAGKSLTEAIERQRDKFPPLYAQLVDAGIRAGNLSAVLLSLGEHMVLFRKFQAAMWRTLTYPLIVLLTFLGIMIFIVTRLTPGLQGFYPANSHVELPRITQVMIAVSGFLSRWQTMTAIVVCVGGLLLLWSYIRISGLGTSLWERLLLPLPIIGQVVRRSLIARWCDTVGLGVEAGLDLPAAIGLASKTINSPGLRADGAAIEEAVTGGWATPAKAGRILPPTVPTTIDLASQRSDLPRALRTLAQMYRQRAENRLTTLPAVLTPFLLLFMGCMAGLLLLAILLPILEMLRGILWW